MPNSEPSLAQHLSKFEAVFCSGFFIPDPAIVTALSLIFERVYFLNNLEFVIDLAQNYEIRTPAAISVPEAILTSVDGINDDPLANLSPSERKTVHKYLYLADAFFVKNALLFPDIFYCTLLPNGEVLSVELIREKIDGGKLNEYRVTKNPLYVSTQGLDEFERYKREGKIPVLSNVVTSPETLNKASITPSQIAAMLALQAIVMVLPATQGARAELILEAREKLRNHLPPFWSAMIKLSVELESQLDSNLTPEKLQQECENTVTTIVRPALIDLVDKLERDRKLWFHKILSPISSGIGLLAGRPPITPYELGMTSVKLGIDTALDISSQIQKVESMKRESGLTYLIELHKVASKKRKKSKRK